MPKSGPGSGCPTVAQYSGGNKKLEDDRSTISDGTIGCYTTHNIYLPPMQKQGTEDLEFILSFL
jgi:hypothetical protein